MIKKFAPLLSYDNFPTPLVGQKDKDEKRVPMLTRITFPSFKVNVLKFKFFNHVQIKR